MKAVRIPTPSTVRRTAMASPFPIVRSADARCPPAKRRVCIPAVAEESHATRKQRSVEVSTGEVPMEIVPGAGHLFEEPGALEQVAQLTRDWFMEHLPAAEASR